jgi:3-hydroxy-9,10-secoandrosta-1,3,5(10)-triene-9,17-dione monooxygenase
MSTSTTDLLGRVRELLPEFRGAAEEGERARAIPRSSVDRMLELGLARVLVPRRFGGDELDLGTWFEITREISKADASHGWCAGLLVHNPMYVAYFPIGGQEQMWAGGPDVPVAGALPPVCRAGPAEGGWRITGHSPFASGVLHAEWSFVGGFLPGEGGVPEWCWFLIPAEDYEIVDTWHVVAMRGTGSNTIATEELFVPDERILRMKYIVEGDVPGERPSDNPMYSLPIASYGPLGFSTSILGAAQGALEEFTAWTAERVDPLGNRFSERVRIQRALAKLAADVDSADLLLRRVVEINAAPEVPDVPLRARSLRDMAHAGQLCIGAIDELVAMSGTAAFWESNVIGRAWRDIHFMAANLGISADNNYTHWGRLALGLERDPHMPIY